MNNFIKKELTGRVYHPLGYTSKVRFVILGVRKSSQWNYYEVLVGRLYHENKETGWSNVSVMSWYAYMGSKHIQFEGRGTHRAIRRCIKSGQYDKLHYHTGHKINMNVAHINESHGRYYEEYYEKCISEMRR